MNLRKSWNQEYKLKFQRARLELCINDVALGIPVLLLYRSVTLHCDVEKC